MADIIIIGNGPAGISAALYACRGGADTLIVGTNSSALRKAEKIENYYGFETPVSGGQLMDTGIAQAKRLGAKIISGEVVGISYDGQYVVTTKDAVYHAHSVIIATGATRATPPITGLKEFEGHGVSYCAECDAFFYRGKDVAVLGNGNYALHEAEALLPVVHSVTILTNEKELSIEVPPAIQVNTKKIIAFTGANLLDSIQFADGSALSIHGVFVAVGVAGSTDLAKKVGAQINGRNIVVNDKMATSLPGLYAAGDCTGGMLQIAKAVYEGAVAGREALKYVKTH